MTSSQITCWLSMKREIDGHRLPARSAVHGTAVASAIRLAPRTLSMAAISVAHVQADFLARFQSFGDIADDAVG